MLGFAKKSHVFLADSFSKLYLKPGLNSVFLNLPEIYNAEFKELGLNQDLNREEKFDFAMLFCESKDGLAQSVDSLMDKVRPETILWFAYPKKTSKIKTDINRDEGWDVLKKYDLLPVRQISLDETWSALMFKPRTKIEKITRKF